MQSTMTTGLIAVFTLALATTAFAGRAFPVKSEHFVGELFSEVNPDLKWDDTSFLEDLSGWYAVCKYRDFNGVLEVKELTPEGLPVAGLVASYPGDASDADAVNDYIKEAMPQWLSNPVYASQIKSADKFGCSVQPSCKGNHLIACLFRSDGNGDFGFGNEIGGNYQDVKGQDISEIIAPNSVIDEPKALAFTPEQYLVAEGIFGQVWDRSHFLENLSGQETDCGMITSQNWGFTKAEKLANNHQMNIETFYGVAENQGETEPAMVEVLQNWRNANIRDAGEVGCSLIPDCMSQGKMFVVVSCIKASGRGNNVGEVKAPTPSFITPPVPTSKPKAYAFTKEQYGVAEGIIGKTWDSSHFLENLSGKETDCQMLRQDKWEFPMVKAEAQAKGVEFQAVFGVTKNDGSSEEAIAKILKSIATPNLSGKVGCSVIPDCIEPRGMFAVVSCIFSE